MRSAAFLIEAGTYSELFECVSSEPIITTPVPPAAAVSTGAPEPWMTSTSRAFKAAIVTLLSTTRMLTLTPFLVKAPVASAIHSGAMDATGAE